MAPLRWGIAAAADIAFDFVNALTVLDKPEERHLVVAVAARSGDRAKEFASKFDIPRSYEGYRRLAEDAEVEAVYVATIHPYHLEVCTIMLEAGKSVLCEKPLAMNVKQTRRLVELARKKGVFLMEAMWTRCLPSHVKMREELAAGAVGEVRHVDVNLGQLIDRERLFKKELGGGSMLDLGVYPTFFVLDVFKGERPEKVVATGYLNDEGTDTFVSATWIYPGGRSATLSTHSKCVLSCEAQVRGDKGSIKHHYMFHANNKVEVNGKVYEWTKPKEPRLKKLISF